MGVGTWLFPLCHGRGVRHAKDTECPDGTVWWSLQLECAICTNPWVAVFPTKPGETDFRPECPSCASVGYVNLDPVNGRANGTDLETP